MALTRKMLKAMGIEPDVIDEIIEAHAETVDGLKQERDTAQANADKANKELAEAKKGLADDDGFKAKYEKEHQEYEDFKAKVDAEKSDAKKRDLYKQLLIDAGVDPKRIDAVMKVSNFDFEVEDGAIKDADKLTEGIKSEWDSFIVSKKEEGSGASNPPAGNTASYEDMSIEEYIKARSSN